ncbi:MAG: hypothetical protein JJT94_01675 [Bernardetiaceae bacterium]|nr:hypothetical protein [Bernardetiaceae bacterium]
MNRFFVIFGVVFCCLFLSLNDAKAQTETDPSESDVDFQVISGKLKVKSYSDQFGSGDVYVCRARRSQVCGRIRKQSSNLASDLFVFPDYFQGPFPPNTFERDGLKMVEGADITLETVPTEDGQSTESVYIIKF